MLSADDQGVCPRRILRYSFVRLFLMEQTVFDSLADSYQAGVGFTGKWMHNQLQSFEDLWSEYTLQGLILIDGHNTRRQTIAFHFILHHLRPLHAYISSYCKLLDLSRL